MSGFRTVVPVVLLALLAGAAIGFFTRPLVDDDSLAERGRATRPVRAESGGSQAPRVAGNTDTSGSRSTAAERASPDSGPEPAPRAPELVPSGPSESRLVGTALESAVAPERQVGDGVITGAVTRSGTGQPIENVLITARQSQAYAPSGDIKEPLGEAPTVPGDAELLKQLENSVKNNRTARAMTWTAFTGPDGSFTIPGLPEAEFTVSASHPRLALTAESKESSYAPGYYDPSYYYPGYAGGASVNGVVPGGTVNFTATTRRMVFIDVLMPDGSPAKGAGLSQAAWPRGQEDASLEDLKATLRYQPTSQRWNGPGDYIALPEGVYALQLNLTPEHGMVTAEPARADVLADGPDPRVVFQLQAAEGVEVSVTSASEELLSRNAYYVNVVKATGPEPDKRALTRASGSKHVTAGKIRLGEAKAIYPGLEPGQYWAVLHQNGVTIDVKPVTFASGIMTVNLSVLPPAREEYVLVRVLSPEGTPVTDASLVATVKSTGQGSRSNSRTTRLPDGSVMVFHAGQDDDRKFTNPVYSVSATSRDYGRVSAEYQLGAASEVTVKFEQPAMLRVTVDGAKGHAAEKLLRMSLVGEESMGYGNADSRIYYDYEAFGFGRPGMASSGQSAGGVFVFGPMQPKEATMVLRISPSGSNWGGFELARESMKLVPGQNTFRFVLPSLYSVSVYAPEGREGTTVTARQSSPPGGPHSSSSASAKLGADLRGVIEHLPPGEYSFSCSGMGTEKITLPGHTSVTFLPFRPSVPNPPSGR